MKTHFISVAILFIALTPWSFAVADQYSFENYPSVKLLNRENYDITEKVPRDSMKQFAEKLPDRYDKQ